MEPQHRGVSQVRSIIKAHRSFFQWAIGPAKLELAIIFIKLELAIWDRIKNELIASLPPDKREQAETLANKARTFEELAAIVPDMSIEEMDALIESKFNIAERILKVRKSDADYGAKRFMDYSSEEREALISELYKLDDSNILRPESRPEKLKRRLKEDEELRKRTNEYLARERKIGIRMLRFGQSLLYSLLKRERHYYDRRRFSLRDKLYDFLHKRDIISL